MWPLLELKAIQKASLTPVSYTHLDVYKRQVQYRHEFGTGFLVSNKLKGAVLDFWPEYMGCEVTPQTSILSVCMLLMRKGRIRKR